MVRVRRQHAGREEGRAAVVGGLNDVGFDSGLVNQVYVLLNDVVRGAVIRIAAERGVLLDAADPLFIRQLPQARCDGADPFQCRHGLLPFHQRTVMMGMWPRGFDLHGNQGRAHSPGRFESAGTIHYRDRAICFPTLAIVPPVVNGEAVHQGRAAKAAVRPLGGSLRGGPGGGKINSADGPAGTAMFHQSQGPAAPVEPSHPLPAR